MKRRDKQVSMKVDSRLFNRFNNIVDKFTIKIDVGYKNIYHCIFPDTPQLHFDKYSIADLLEDALYRFIIKYENFDNENQTIK